MGSTGLGDAIAEAIAPRPLRKKLLSAKKLLEREARRVAKVVSGMEANEKRLFERIVKLKQAGDTEAAERLAAELSQLKKVEDTLRKTGVMLEAVATKLEGAVGLGDSVAALVEASRLLAKVSATMSKLMPSAEKSLSEVNASLNEALESLSGLLTPGSEDAYEILEEARKVAEKSSS